MHSTRPSARWRRQARCRFVNFHGEILPDYPGGQSVIWPIYFGRRETGFTIHSVAKGIDTGEIVYQERRPIRFGATLRETVEGTLAEATDRVPAAFAELLEHWDRYWGERRPNVTTRHFTSHLLAIPADRTKPADVNRGGRVPAGAGDKIPLREIAAVDRDARRERVEQHPQRNAERQREKTPLTTRRALGARSRASAGATARCEIASGTAAIIGMPGPTACNRKKPKPSM